jgi:hypothetical protein
MWFRVLAAAAVFALAFCSGARAQPMTPDVTETPRLDLSVEQRQLIFTSISSMIHKSTAAPAAFLPAIGVSVPTAVETLPIPDTVVEVVPKLRGYVCALVANQALIIDPKSRKVIEILSGGSEPRNPPARS